MSRTIDEIAVRRIRRELRALVAAHPHLAGDGARVVAALAADAGVRLYQLPTLGGEILTGFRFATVEAALAEWPDEERVRLRVCAFALPLELPGEADTFDAFPLDGLRPLGAVLVADWAGRAAMLSDGVLRYEVVP